MNNKALLCSLAFIVFFSLAVTPHAIQAETYTYDDIGRLTGVTYDDNTTLSYTYDANGNRLTRIAAIAPPDTTAPVVTPPADIQIEATGPTTAVSLGSASVTDDVSTGLIASPDQTGPFAVGTHKIIWSATDAAGNTGTATQTVIVQDTTPPALALSGGNTITLRQGDVFSDPGASATDLVDGAVTVNVTGTVDTSTPGSYTLSYSAADNVGNMSAVLTRTVQVTAAANVTLPNNETVQIDLPAGSEFSGTPATAPVANAPAGIVPGFGNISFSVTVPAAGDSATIGLSFSMPLPDNMSLYKVDNANVYTLIPASQWSQTGPDTLSLTLTDGGAFDLDGLANAVIVDPIAVGSAATQSPPQNGGGGGGGGGAFSPLALLGLLVGWFITCRRRSRLKAPLFLAFIAAVSIAPSTVHATHGFTHRIVLLAKDIAGADQIIDDGSVIPTQPYAVLLGQQLTIEAGNDPFDSCAATVTVSVDDPTLAAVTGPTTQTGDNLQFPVFVNNNNKLGLFKIDVSFVGVDFPSGPGPCTSTGTHSFSLEVIDPQSDSSANTPNSGTSNDPVDTSNGELFFFESPDLSLGGPLPLVFQRYYASYLRRSFVVGELGDNWRHNFEWAVHWTGNNLVLMDDTGRVVRYLSDGQGNWTQQSNFETAYQLQQNGQEIDLYNPETGLFYNFDAFGRLAAVSDGKGNTHTLSYNTNGKLGSVSDGLGRTLVFGYTTIGSLNKLTTVTEQQNGVNQRSIAFTYDTTGDNLLNVVDANGGVTVYNYFPPEGADRGLLQTKTWPRGNTRYSQTYYTTADGVDSGKVKTQSDSLNNTHTFTYSGGNTTITDPVGNIRIHTNSAAGEFTANQDEDGNSFTMGYDSKGRRNSLTDRLGDTSSYTFDPTSGAIASITNADGTTTSNSYTSRTFNGFILRDLTGRSYPDGTSESFTYDASGNLLTQTLRDGSQWSYTYNNRGQVLTATNPLGGITTLTYNSDGTLATVTDPAGNTTTYSYDAMRRLITLTQPDGKTVSFSYDNLDQLLSATDELGNTTTTSYDANGNVTATTDRAGNTRTFTPDTMDRLSTSTDALGNSASRTYDPLAQLKTTTDRNGNTTTLDYDARGRLTSVTDEAGKVWRRSYDLESIIASATDPLGNTTTFVSDNMGRITRSTTPLGNATDLSYDTMGRVSTVQNPLGETTTIAYDANGRVAGITLPNGAATAYTRNGLGQLTQATDPNGGNWGWSFDNSGRQTGSTDPLGNALAVTFDNRNRPAVITYPGTLGTLTIGYDAAGRPISRSYSDGTLLNYTYDAEGGLTAANGISHTFDANRRIVNTNGIAVGYDAGGRITALTLAPGKTVSYAYDARDLPVSVTDWAGGVTTFAYDDAGRLLTITRPNGITTGYTWDNDGNLIGITEGSVASISLTRDAKGQITGATRNMPQTASSSGLSDSAQTFDAASQLAGATYDALGRITASGSDSYTWDLASRLTSYTRGGATVSATYDAAGLRLSRTTGGTTRNYVWNTVLGIPSISIERQGGTDLRYYIHTPGGALLYSIDATSNARSFYHFDEMGNTTLVSDDAGATIGSYAYTPFGELIASTGGLDNPFTWQGQYGVMDEGNGLYYVRVRYYDSATGRFVSRDPIKLVGPRSINPYQYAFNNPLNYIDVTGRKPKPRRTLREEMDFFADTLVRWGAEAANKGAVPLPNLESFRALFDSTDEHIWKRTLKALTAYEHYSLGLSLPTNNSSSQFFINYKEAAPSTSNRKASSNEHYSLSFSLPTNNSSSQFFINYKEAAPSTSNRKAGSYEYYSLSISSPIPPNLAISSDDCRLGPSSIPYFLDLFKLVYSFKLVFIAFSLNQHLIDILLGGNVVDVVDEIQGVICLA